MAKQTLYNFTHHHPDAGMVKGTILFISGKLCGTEMINVRLIRKDDLQKTRAHFSEVKSVHVYSVQKSEVLDIDEVQQIVKGNSLTDRLRLVPNLSIVNRKAVVQGDIQAVINQEQMSKGHHESKIKKEEFPKRTIQPGIKEFVSKGHGSKIKVETANPYDPDLSQAFSAAEYPVHTEDRIQLIDKYRPESSTAIIGQQGENSVMKELKKWLEKWHENCKITDKSIGKPIGRNKGSGAGFKGYGH